MDYESSDKIDVAASNKPGHAKSPGVEASYKDSVVGLGYRFLKETTYKLNSDGTRFTDDNEDYIVTDSTGTSVATYLKTPKYDFDGFKTQFAVTGTKSAGDKTKNVGLSAKASYATDVLSASVATDLGLAITDKTTVGADVVANVKYDFVTVDGYYATKAQTKNDKSTTENLLSVKVATDLNSFDVPVKLTLAGKDLVNKQNLSAEVEVVAVEGLTVKANGGYGIKDKKVSVGGGVEYKADAFKATANVGFSTVVGTEKSSVLTLDAAVESDVIVPGATLKLAYGAAKNDQNLLDKQTASDVTAKNLGKVVASATIKF